MLLMTPQTPTIALQPTNKFYFIRRYHGARKTDTQFYFSYPIQKSTWRIRQQFLWDGVSYGSPWRGQVSTLEMVSWMDAVVAAGLDAGSICDKLSKDNHLWQLGHETWNRHVVFGELAASLICTRWIYKVLVTNYIPIAWTTYTKDPSYVHNKKLLKHKSWEKLLRKSRLHLTIIPPTVHESYC